MRHSNLPLSLLLAAALAACQQTPAPPAATPAPQSPTAAAAPTEPSIPEQQGQTTTYLYQCGELAVTASFHGDDDADLTFNGRVLKLPRVVSASGARYADTGGNEFWSKGDVEAILTLAGEAQRSCTGPGANPA
ncbi:MAG TPA: MliC family protein [Pseudoxanthomonas sp.]|jgi:membrane-bound inhibitor of C-type lysozyme|nr:MliC family protein [Pseudoxanthomonas sp.]